MADLNIGDKNVIINFVDSVKPENVVTVNGTPYNGSYKIDNIMTFKTQLNVFSSDFFCSYKYTINLGTSLQYKKFTIRTGLDNENCAFQIEKLPQQTDADFQKYQADVMKMITISEVKQVQKPFSQVTISESYLFFIISAFLVGLLVSIVFFTNMYYKRSDFITK